MPKDRRVDSPTFNHARVSPYACTLKTADRNNSESCLPRDGDEREWEEVRCSICMEHPHNAVMLICFSREKGCRPFMCDTSYRHSNCLDQFLKSSTLASSSTGPREQQSELLCPPCRGQITGLVVKEPARKFMNSKTRSCSLETCNFSGNYMELRKHARLEHPSDRPSVPSPTRQSNWATLEQQRDIEDALAHQLDFDNDWDAGHSWNAVGDLDFWGDWDARFGWNEVGDVDFLIDWSEANFFDFIEEMSDAEDEMIGGLPLSYAILGSSSREPEMNNSNFTRSRDRHQRSSNLTPRPNNHGGEAFRITRSTLLYHREDDPTILRSRTSSRRENSSSRSSYHRDDSAISRRSHAQGRRHP